MVRLRRMLALLPVLGFALASGCAAPATAEEHGQAANTVLLELRDGITRASKATLCPAATSAATLPS